MTVSARHNLMRYALAAIAFGVAALGFALLPAHAGTPPSCNCHPPSPPPPPHNCNCHPTVVVPPPNVPPPNIIVVNASARAQAQASASSIAIAIAQPGVTTIHYNSIVEGGVAASVTSSLMAVTDVSVETSSSTHERAALIQAICLDDTSNPHPASQTFGDKNVPNDYAGELFRCMSGTHLMRVAIAGHTFDCAAGQALWYEHAQVTCKTQIERRPCNERSLLRRFGPGDKTALLRDAETHTARRETQFSGAMTMDGGVGGAAY